MSLSVCFPPKTSACFLQPAHFLERSLWYSLSGEVSAVKMETLNLQQHLSLACNNSASAAQLVDPILAVSLSWERQGIKSKLKALSINRTCPDFTKQSYYFAKSRFLGYITVVYCMFLRDLKNVVSLQFTASFELQLTGAESRSLSCSRGQRCGCSLLHIHYITYFETNLWQNMLLYLVTMLLKQI